MDHALRERLINVLLVLLIVIAVLYLAQILWQMFAGFADLFLLFVLGWLVSFMLNPMVAQLSHRPIPMALDPWLQSTFGEARARSMANFRFSREAAVIIVYLALVLVIVIAVALLVPTAIMQLTQLASRLPGYMDRVPEVSQWIQTQLAERNLHINVQQAVDSGLSSLQSYTTTIIQNALTIFASLLGLLANLFFVLILGFIMTMDGPRLRKAVLKRVPQNFLDEAHFFSESISRTFGGFLRGQLFQAFLVAIGTGLVMTFFGLNYILIASLFAGLFMLIPLVGSVLALIPPLLVALFQSPDVILWLFILLFVYQFVIVNVLMPRVLSDSLGLHPLLVFGAILISVRIAGFWGAFFGIPVAGVLWAMALFFFERWQSKRTVDEETGK